MIDYVVYGLPCLLAPYLLGWGLTALLLPDRFRGYEAWFAPWIGMAQTALVLMAFGSLGTGVRRSWPAAILVAAILLAAAAARGGLRIGGGARVVLPPIGLVFVIASLVLVPLFTRWDGLNTFTLGNDEQRPVHLRHFLPRGSASTAFFPSPVALSGTRPRTTIS